jgi:hypothetical protein
MGHPNWVGCDMVNVQFEYVVMLDVFRKWNFPASMVSRTQPSIITPSQLELLNKKGDQKQN